MSQDISDTFALQLQHLRTEMIAQIRAQRGGKIGRAEAAPDRHDVQSGDRAQNVAERDLAFSIDGRETEALTAIDLALKRIAVGSYGLCIDCGVDIPTARLHANPTAARCVGCQTRHEHQRGETHPSM